MTDMACLKNACRAFSLSKSAEICLREREIATIHSFLRSNQPVLHICGNPGTGKTHVATRILRSAFYINYYGSSGVLDKVRRTSKSVVIIDEFDKYYTEKRSESLQVMCLLKESGKKLVTLSNNLRISTDALFFEPYTSSDMEKILVQRLGDSSVMAPTVVKIISRRLGASGDLRLLFKFMQDVLERKIANDDASEISPEDLVLEREKPRSRSNIHHDIINRLMSSDRRRARVELYSEYLRECADMEIQSHDRMDFNIIYDIYK